MHQGITGSEPRWVRELPAIEAAYGQRLASGLDENRILVDDFDARFHRIMLATA